MADGCAPKRVFLRKVLYRIDFQNNTEQKQEEKSFFQRIKERFLK